jgi:hypothetical protein
MMRLLVIINRGKLWNMLLLPTFFHPQFMNFFFSPPTIFMVFSPTLLFGKFTLCLSLLPLKFFSSLPLLKTSITDVS